MPCAIVCSESRSTAAAIRSASSRAQAPVRGHVDDPELAARQRAGLVEDHGGEVARLLETAAIADEQSRLRAETRGDGRHQRHGEPERVRAGDDEHRHQPFDGKRAGRSDREPDDERERARDDRDDRQQERGAVGQRLRTGAGRLRLFNQPHDVGERGPLAGARHRHAKGAGAVDGAGDDLRALDLCHRTDSPVIIDSFTSLLPLCTTPSAGTLAPGRTSTRSPSRSAEISTSSIVSPTMRCAVLGSSRASSRSAP